MTQKRKAKAARRFSLRLLMVVLYHVIVAFMAHHYYKSDASVAS